MGTQTHSMAVKNPFSILLISTLLFGLLFYHHSLGLNLVIYELAIFAWLYFTKQINTSDKMLRLLLVAQGLTLLFTIWHHSTWSYFIHFCVSILFVGALIAPGLRSILSALGMGMSNCAMSFRQFLSPVEKEQNRRKSRGYRFKLLRYYILPFIVILVFVGLYGAANPEFGNYAEAFFEKLEDLFGLLNLWFIGTLLLGFMISIVLFRRARNQRLGDIDARANDSKLRVKSGKRFFKPLGLKNESHAAVFLFASLNAILLFMNVLDIDHVWLNFKWEGQYLRQFVHYGTIVLIAAIVLSAGLVLYLFRGNLSFYSKNKTLKILCYAWLAQNVILAISAGLRNMYYIQYYSLAYKRIAIVFFLLLAIYGLYSVYVKIRDTRSVFYILRKNALVWLLVLVVSAGFNWDRIIAEYNFSRGKNAFVHLNYLAHLSDSALPDLDQPLAELQEIHQYQEQSFFDGSSLSSRLYSLIYLDPKVYCSMITLRKRKFIERWEASSWLEWNFAESRSYGELTK